MLVDSRIRKFIRISLVSQAMLLGIYTNILKLKFFFAGYRYGTGSPVLDITVERNEPGSLQIHSCLFRGRTECKAD